MSASDKKKLRKEENAVRMSERQRQEQAEAKKLKAYTITFAALLLAVIVAGTALIVAPKAIDLGKNISAQYFTTAATVGDHKISSPEMSYYFNDAVSELYNEYASEDTDNVDLYLKSILGLDTSIALDEQTNPMTEQLWSEYFLEEALNDARNDYALYDLAMANGFELSEEDAQGIDTTISNLEMYASLYGYSNTNRYLRACYGDGASVKSYRKYIEHRTIADAYAAEYSESLEFTDEQLRAHEADKYNDYTSFKYTNLYLSVNAFLADGATDEEKEQARTKLTEAATELATATNVEELETKLAALELAEGKVPTIYKEQSSLYPSLTATNADLAAWICDEARTEGEVGAIPNEATVTNENGEEVKEVNGYYIVIFHNKNENKTPLANVRHLLVMFEGGTEDEETGEITYSDEEKAATKAKAEAYLQTWKEGEATEESFIELLLEHSEDTGVESNSGLYEDISPESSYVTNFLNWSIDPSRQVGDTDVIETEYGYHVMYFSSFSDISYRDQKITEELRTEAYDTWYAEVTEAVTATLGNTSKLTVDLVLNPQ